MTGATNPDRLLVHATNHAIDGVRGIQATRCEETVRRVSFVLVFQSSVVGFLALPNRRDLDDAITLHQIAVEQARRALTDDEIGPDAEHVSALGALSWGVGNGQNQTETSLRESLRCLASPGRTPGHGPTLDQPSSSARIS